MLQRCYKAGINIESNSREARKKNAILTLVDDPNYQGHRANAKKTWEEKYHASKNYQEFTDDILQLIN